MSYSADITDITGSSDWAVKSINALKALAHCTLDRPRIGAFTLFTVLSYGSAVDEIVSGILAFTTVLLCSAVAFLISRILVFFDF